jgi:catechol 2,3-dioxygenase-like lactoylglutathione lyase family enzyme
MQSLSLWAAMAVVTVSFVQSVQASATPHVGCPDVPVHELDRSVLFYTSVLEFNLQSTKDTSATAWVEPGLTRTASARTAHLTLGEECLDLTQYGSPQGKAFPMDSHADDLWFQHIAIVVSDMHAAHACDDRFLKGGRTA